MFDFPGVTPPASVVNVQCAGSPSFVPPPNALSLTLGSGLSPTRPAACSASQSVKPASLAWLPSPPWKPLPGSGAEVGASGAASASAALAVRATAVATMLCHVRRLRIFAHGHPSADTAHHPLGV